MMKALVIGVVLFGSLICKGQQLRNGDLLFQNLDCGPLCSAIEEVTQGRDSLKFSHIGLVYVEGDSTWIIEAIGAAVCKTPLYRFLSRTKNPHYLGRLKSPPRFIDTAVSFALKQIGTPYDDPFLYNNQKYYCSELIYDAFQYANNNKPFFALEPMTFKQPGSASFYPAWIEYYNKLGIPIPEGQPGINPAGISRNDKLIWMGVYPQASLNNNK